MYDRCSNIPLIAKSARYCLYDRRGANLMIVDAVARKTLSKVVCSLFHQIMWCCLSLKALASHDPGRRELCGCNKGEFTVNRILNRTR